MPKIIISRNRRKGEGAVAVDIAAMIEGWKAEQEQIYEKPALAKYMVGFGPMNPDRKHAGGGADVQVASEESVAAMVNEVFSKYGL